eukprot:Skav200962  [mRNA]  locus=scaffold448:471860:473407:- [translate_table: standard]
MDPGTSQGELGDAMAPNLLALEAGEIENRLRKHTIELTEPAIARTAAFERKLREVRLYTDHNAENLKQLQQKLSGQENVKLTVESFRGELFEWDKERRDHQHLMNEKLCLQEDELSALHRKIELQSFRTEAVGRGLKQMGDLLAETKEELSELRGYCSERIDVNREKIYKLRDELEAKHSAIETTQFKLCDDITSMTTVFEHVHSEIEKAAANSAKAVQSAKELWYVKANVASVEEQQATFEEFSRSLSDAVGSLKMQLDNVIVDVQEQFHTATQVMAASTAKQIGNMRSQYAEDIAQMDSIIKENSALNQRIAEQEQSFQASLASIREHFGAEISKLHDSLTEKDKPDPIREEFILEVQQLRRSCKEFQERIVQHERARALERDGMHAIVESQQIAAQIHYHDDQDRNNIALFGCKPVVEREGLLPSIDPKASQTPRSKDKAALSAPLVSLDKRCLSCCGGAGSVLAGFKIACLNYTAGPVEYRQAMYSRAELLHLQSKLVDQAYDRMQRAANM